jgi:hypothetical protein
MNKLKESKKAPVSVTMKPTQTVALRKWVMT